MVLLIQENHTGSGMTVVVFHQWRYGTGRAIYRPLTSPQSGPLLAGPSHGPVRLPGNILPDADEAILERNLIPRSVMKRSLVASHSTHLTATCAQCARITARTASHTRVSSAVKPASISLSPTSVCKIRSIPSCPPAWRVTKSLV